MSSGPLVHQASPIAALASLQDADRLRCRRHTAPASDYFAVILPALLVAGVGSGLVFVAATAVAVHGVTPARQRR
jgi:hypothetical protein